MFSPHHSKFKTAYYGASKKYPNFERYIDKLERSSHQIVKRGPMGSVTVVNNHTPSAPTAPNRLEFSAPYTYETTERSGTLIGPPIIATVDLEQGEAMMFS